MVHRLTDALLRQHGHLLLWVPICLAFGIGWYFAAPIEPDLTRLKWTLAGALALLLLRRWVIEALRPFLWVPALIVLGAVFASHQAHRVAAPVLEFRYYGEVVGRVVSVDKSASDATRLTLDKVWLSSVRRSRTPLKVRISLHGPPPDFDPAPGQRIRLEAHLSPPGGPVEPGGFDFQRHAWFLQLGAVGYTRKPVHLMRSTETGGLMMSRIRHGLSTGIQQRIDGDAGAFAAAISTGDRSGMRQETIQMLRHSNLAHLLAISGLHLGLLTGVVYGALRFAGALWSRAALGWPVKKVAAVGAILAGAAYLALSGGAIATERAFIMATVIFVGVLLGRRAITLRGVSIAAIIVLVLRPDALTGPGFQMSFAATTALVAVFASVRGKSMGPPAMRWFLTLLLSSAVAGIATAPFGAAHFNMVSRYGLIANLLSVPVMGALVMPAAVVAAVLAPLGLEQVGLWGMELGLRWILFIAEWSSSLPGAVGHVPAPAPLTLPLLTIGGLLFALWRGHFRWAGVVPMALAGLLWVQAERPTLLIAETGGLMGRMSAEGRALSTPKGDGFAAELWLENDGAPVPQAVAAERPGFSREGKTFRTEVANMDILLVRGKRALAALDGCGGAELLVTNSPVDERPCDVFGPERLSQTGSLAIMRDGRIVTARAASGERIWNTPSLRSAQEPQVLRDY